MYMFTTPGFQEKDGHIEMLAPTFMHCGCFTGDTIVDFQMNENRTKREPIEKFYEWFKKNNGKGKITVRGKKIERVGRNEVLDVKCLGERAIVKLTFEDGTTIRCTPDHLFWTPTGWVRAEDMAGREGMKDNRCNKTGYRQERFSDPRVCVPGVHPYARRQKSVSKNKGKEYVSYSNVIELHRAMFECYLNGYETLDEWKKNMKATDYFVDPEVYVVHHIDNNHFNNSKDNLCLLTDRGHKLIHSGNENGLVLPSPVACVSVEDAGAEKVYDIVCDTYNSYTANQFVVHNCGSIRARLASVLQYVPMSARQLNQCNPSSSAICKRYLEQEHLNEEIKLLKNHTYGVLIDNKLTNGKHKWVDVNAGASTDVAAKFREILNVPEPHQLTKKDSR